MSEREIQEPVLSAESGPFWEATVKGHFLIKHCENCDQNFWYPRHQCPFCWSDRTVWLQSSGRGRVYSFSPMRRAKVPYVLAYVTLEEGPTVMTNLVNVDPDAIRIDMPVEVTFAQAVKGTRVPVFQPAASGG